MGFTYKTLVIIDVGIDDDTGYGDVVFSPGAQTWYVRTAACVFFFHYLVDSVVKDMRQNCLIIFWSKIYNCMLDLCTNTLSITNNTITNNTIVGIYIYKWILLVIAYQHLKPGTQIFGHLIGEFDLFILIWQIQIKSALPTHFFFRKNYGKQVSLTMTI